MEKYQIIIPWVFSFLTIFLSFITMRMQSRNFELNRRQVVLSGNRQEWINTLRNTVGELLAEHNLILVTNRNKIDDNDYLNRLRNIAFLQHKIQLLINPNEEDSQKLVSYIFKLNRLSDFSKDADNSEYDQMSDNIISLTQKILKTEWERVKRLE